MRTTLTLDDDVALKLRELAHRRRVPFKEVVNSVLRLGWPPSRLAPSPGDPSASRSSGAPSGRGSIP
jgi:hypothetical protein